VGAETFTRDLQKRKKGGRGNGTESKQQGNLKLPNKRGLGNGKTTRQTGGGDTDIRCCQQRRNATILERKN